MTRATTWVLETPVFPASGPPLEAAIRAAGHEVIAWDDAWWGMGVPALPERRVVFHGSLANAARVHAELPWSPGAFCDVAAFHGTAYYEDARPWLLHEGWRATTAAALCEDPALIADGIADPQGRVFVRPDSPLKPFSGRVLAVDAITPDALDHGYYFDDLGIPVLVAPVRAVGGEWRFVVVDQVVVAGCGYEADARAGSGADVPAEVHAVAVEVAASMKPPASVYVLDLCAVEGGIRLLELNPFGGADLYGCDPHAIVRAIDEALSV